MKYGSDCIQKVIWKNPIKLPNHWNKCWPKIILLLQVSLLPCRNKKNLFWVNRQDGWTSIMLILMFYSVSYQIKYREWCLRSIINGRYIKFKMKLKKLKWPYHFLNIYNSLFGNMKKIKDFSSKIRLKSILIFSTASLRVLYLTTQPFGIFALIIRKHILL